jgi:hypothetical protein
MNRPPDAQLVAIARPDGGVSIMQFVTAEYGRDDKPRWTRDATDNAIAAEIARASLDCTSWRRIAAADIPPDRTFRGAWKDGGAAVDVDMPKARDIHRDRMRQAREPKLAALDIEYQRADEKGDAAAKADIAARKQALRDVTADPAIEAAQTPDELKAVWPAVL